MTLKILPGSQFPGNTCYPSTSVLVPDSFFLQVIDMIAQGFFSHGDKDTFKNIVDNLLYHDR